MNVLVVAPHGDDEVLGCGGVMHQLAASHAVYVLYMCYGDEGRRGTQVAQQAEMTNACNILKATGWAGLAFPDQRLDTLAISDMANAVANYCEQIGGVSSVFIPSFASLNTDHRLTYEAALVALRRRKCNVYAYHTPQPGGMEWAGLRPNACLVVDISDSFSPKTAAMQCYKSEVENFPGLRSTEAMRSEASVIGLQFGLAPALCESFEVVRRYGF